jgi:hypothetical protein
LVVDSQEILKSENNLHMSNWLIIKSMYITNFYNMKI